MKKIFAGVLIFGLAVFFTANFASACSTIQDGTITADDGVTIITTGYDEFGYNYQAHVFNGRLCDQDRELGGSEVECSTDLIIKWNDAWLSNMNCDGDDTLLDRPTDDGGTYHGTGAWATNHLFGKVEWPEGSGKYKKWSRFRKAVAVPSDAYILEGFWYDTNDTQIGLDLGLGRAMIQDIFNHPDPNLNPDGNGVQYNSPIGPGFGQFGTEELP
ncbi:MAG: hypothetical protein ACYST3_08280 [Planctomycetota bacterium]|jgi:hypothetical protein